MMYVTWKRTAMLQESRQLEEWSDLSLEGRSSPPSVATAGDGNAPVTLDEPERNPGNGGATSTNRNDNLKVRGGQDAPLQVLKPLAKPIAREEGGGRPPKAAPEIKAGPPPGGMHGKLWEDLIARSCATDFSAAITKQLKPWAETGIQMGMLDRLYCIRKQVSRVSIRGGELRQANWQLNMDHNRLRSSFWLIQLVLQRSKQRNDPLPDVEMILNPTDKTARFASGRQQKDEAGIELRSAPLMCNVKCANDTSISFPLYYHTLYGLPDGTMSLEMYHAKFTALEHLGTNSGWDEKKDKLFFSATNARGHREKLFHIKSPYLEAAHKNVPLKTYGEYKYNVYTYGHSGWSRRLREMMFMNTTVFMETSSCNEFFFDALQPGTDYVPVAEDLSDLRARLESVAQDPESARIMSNNWLTNAKPLMRLECILDYIEQLLRAYAKLQKFTPPDRSDWGLHTLESGSKYFLESMPPNVATCRPYF